MCHSIAFGCVNMWWPNIFFFYKSVFSVLIFYPCVSFQIGRNYTEYAIFILRYFQDIHLKDRSVLKNINPRIIMIFCAVSNHNYNIIANNRTMYLWSTGLEEAPSFLTVVSDWKSDYFWQSYGHLSKRCFNFDKIVRISVKNGPIVNPEPPLKSLNQALLFQKAWGWAY